MAQLAPEKKYEEHAAVSMGGDQATVDASAMLQAGSGAEKAVTFGGHAKLDGTLDHSTVTDEDRKAAARVLDEFHQFIDVSVQKVKDYHKLFIFMIYVTFFLSVVSMQARFTSRSGSMYELIKGNLFDVATQTVDQNGVVLDTMASKEVFYDWLDQKLLKTIFVKAPCGDNICEAPDEYPQFQAADDARQFVGCAADCGRAPTKKVTVHFFDAWKLYYAYEEMAYAFEYGFRGKSAVAWGATDSKGNVLIKPQAAWNLCSVNLKQFGYFEEVCIFDGDVFIQGKPYRTAELEEGSSLYAIPKEVDLFEGEWEVRIAYDGFAWPDASNNGEMVNIAYPAVRGHICQGEPDADDYTCEPFAPCLGVEECKNEYWKGETFQVDENGGWTNWQDIFREFTDQVGVNSMGTYLNFEYEPTLNSSVIGDDDQWETWSESCSVHTVTVRDTYGDSWNGAELQIIKAGSGEVVFSTFGPGYSSGNSEVTSEIGVLCPASAYSIVFPTTGYYPSEIEWSVSDGAERLVVEGTTPSYYDDCPAYGADFTFGESCGGGGDDDPSGSYGSYGPSYGGPGRRRLEESTVNPLFKLDLGELRGNTTHPSDWETAVKKLIFGDSDITSPETFAQCIPTLMGDSTCNEVNNNMNCGFDGGDCCPGTCSDCDEDTVTAWEKVPQCQSADKLNGWLGEDDNEVNLGWAENQWPFYHQFDRGLTESKRSFMHYPYNAWELVLEYFENAYGGAYKDTVHLPSVMCPDCDPRNGLEYMSVTFSVAPEQPLFYPMFPALPENGTRTRRFIDPNQLLGGVLLRQRRIEMGECVRSPNWVDFEPSCPARAVDETGPFGADPTFLPTSTLYRESNTDKMDIFYPGEGDLNDQMLPYGFFVDQGSGMPNVDGYPILFDINFNETRVAQTLTYMKDGKYIDTQTDWVTAVAIVYNPNIGFLGRLSFLFESRNAGGYTFKYAISLLDTQPYGDPEDDNRLASEIIFMVFLFACIFIEFHEMWETWREHRSVLPYFTDPYNMLDMANYSLQFAIMLVWFEYAVLCGELHPHLRYDVYESCTTGSFCMTQARQLKMGEKMQDLSDFHESVDVVILAKKRWESYTAVSCILVCLQMLKNLDFHPRMGLVTRTMKKGAVDLTYFSLLFGFVNCIYAFLGTLIFGEEMAAYENFMMAFETCLRTVIGLYSPMDEDEFLINQKVLALTYFWSFLFLTFFILLNALLAIIVEAYDGAKEASKKEIVLDPLEYERERLMNFLKFGLEPHTFVTLEACVKAIECSRNGAPYEWEKLIPSRGRGMAAGQVNPKCSVNIVVFERNILNRIPHTVYLDQTAVTTLLCVSLGPQLPWRVAACIANRLVEYYGVNVDADGDGEVDEDELNALIDERGGGSLDQAQGIEALKAQLTAKFNPTKKEMI